MMRTIASSVVACSVAVVLVFILFIPIDVFGMGGFEPPGGIEPRRDGPVSAPEPGIITLVGMVLAAGAGYYLGKKKK